MKKLLLLPMLACGISSAQPVIVNGNNVPAPGYTAVVSAAATSNFGTAGANQTWNFSALTFTPLGTANIISPSSSTMSSSFPTANYAYTFAGTTSFFNVSSAKMEAQAYSITSPGTGNDMSPNPRTVLQFPFNFNNVVTDTWQKVGGAVNTVTLTYDGYGTLMMPSMTYSNVVRVKEDYGNGSDYQWYILNPLMSVLAFDHNNNVMYFTGATPTGLQNRAADAYNITVFPNPATDKLVINSKINDNENNVAIIHNVFGQEILSVVLKAGENEIKLNDLTTGTYFYKIISNGVTIKTGKIIKAD